MKTKNHRKLEEDKLEDFALMARIAELYYLKNKSQKEIEDLVEKRQPEVSRYLRKAKEMGIVRIEIEPRFKVDLAGELKKEFPHLEQVIITWFSDLKGKKTQDHLLQGLGHKTAEYILSNVPDGASIGVSCGATLDSALELLGEVSDESDNELPVNCEVYALLHLALSEVTSITPAALVVNLVKQLRATKGHAYQLPVTKDGLNYYRELTVMKDLFKKIENLDFYFIGIGSIDYERKFPRTMTSHQFNSLIQELKARDSKAPLRNVLKEMEAVGESVHQPFDRNGKFLIKDDRLESLRKRIICLGLPVLRQLVENKSATVVAVAGGKNKHPAICAALKAKFFNVLITDSESAMYVLREKKSC